MKIRNRKPPFVLNLTQVEKFECEEKHHVITTFQYGSHPARVYAICPFCQQFAIINWRDPRARFTNRLLYSIPAIWQAALVFIVIGGLIYYLFAR